MACFVALLFAGASSHAAWKNTGPFARTNPSPVFQRVVVNWLDNLTVGAVQTTIGAGHILVSLIANPLIGEKFPTPRFEKKNSGQQLVSADALTINGVGYSLGLFNVGPEAAGDPAHEAGHSQESAVLGPLYLPTALLDYMIEAALGACFPYSCGSEFIERWADLEAAHFKKMAFTKAARVGTGFIRKNDVTLPVLTLAFELDERFDGSDSDGMRIRKYYEWLKTEIAVPLARTQEKVPLFFEVNALKKTESLDVELAGGFQVGMQSEQNYGQVSFQPGTGTLRIDALEWSPGFRIAFDPIKQLQIFAAVGGSVSATALVQGPAKAAVGAGAYVLAGITLFDYATIYGKYEKEWVLGYFERTTKELGASNVYRSPKNKVPGLWNYLDFSAKYLHETVSAEAQAGAAADENRIHTFLFSVGGRL